MVPASSKITQSLLVAFWESTGSKEAHGSPSSEVNSMT